MSGDYMSAGLIIIYYAVCSSQPYELSVLCVSLACYSLVITYSPHQVTLFSGSGRRILACSYVIRL